jgi:hypothetical protein
VLLLVVVGGAVGHVAAEPVLKTKVVSPATLLATKARTHPV